MSEVLQNVGLKRWIYETCVAVVTEWCCKSRECDLIGIFVYSLTTVWHVRLVMLCAHNESRFWRRKNDPLFHYYDSMPRWMPSFWAILGRFRAKFGPLWVVVNHLRFLFWTWWCLRYCTVVSPCISTFWVVAGLNPSNIGTIWKPFFSWLLLWHYYGIIIPFCNNAY